MLVYLIRSLQDPPERNESLENKLRAYDSPGDLSERKSSCDLRERESKAMNLVPDQLRGGGPLNWESTGLLSDIESILGGDS